MKKNQNYSFALSMKESFRKKRKVSGGGVLVQKTENYER
jgi:hypothetical protein